jgi:hypothetical protein
MSIPFLSFFHDGHAFRAHDDAQGDETGDGHDDNCGDDSAENADACGMPFLQNRQTLWTLPKPSGIKIKDRKVWLLLSFQIGILMYYFLFSLYRWSGVPSFLV